MNQEDMLEAILQCYESGTSHRTAIFGRTNERDKRENRVGTTLFTRFRSVIHSPFASRRQVSCVKHLLDHLASPDKDCERDDDNATSEIDDSWKDDIQCAYGAVTVVKDYDTPVRKGTRVAIGWKDGHVYPGTVVRNARRTEKFVRVSFAVENLRASVSNKLVYVVSDTAKWRLQVARRREELKYEATKTN